LLIKGSGIPTIGIIPTTIAKLINIVEIKGVLKLGFSSDPLIRWVFPDPNIYLVNFDTWMEEFSKI